MSSGAGPFAVAVSTAALSTTAETTIGTIVGSWSENLGNLMSCSVIATASGAATITFRIRQQSLTGPLVTGSTAIYTFAGAATTVNVAGIEVVDTSAYALGPVIGQTYVLTAQASVSSTITPTGGVFEMETMAPIQ